MSTPPIPRHAAADADLQSASTGELVTKLANQVSELVRGEMELARNELVAKGKRAGVGAGALGAAGVGAVFGAGLIVACVTAALALALPVWAATLVIGVLILLAAGLLALIGRGQLKRATTPAREGAVEGVRQDVATVKEAVHR